jgi:LPS export ABC transporter permease LptG/LPS export ABC transporter permease LptF
MRKIDKLLFYAIVPPFVISLIVLTFVVFIHELGNRSEWLLVRNASLDLIIYGMAAILPAVLIYSLPLSYLIGILIGLTGLSGEYQIMALRACGVPLRTLLRFILILGFVVGFTTAVLSVVILPEANYEIRRIQNRISLAQATSLIHPRVFNEDFPKVVFYLDNIDKDRQQWSRVFFVDNRDPQSPQIVTMAESCEWIEDSANQGIQLYCKNGNSYPVNPQDHAKDSVDKFATTLVSINTRRDLDYSNQRRVSEQNTLDLLRNHSKSPASEGLRQLIELHRRLALPFSMLPFALLGLTLAVSAPKGGRTLGFAFSLVAVLLFYILFMNGLRLANVGKIPPWIGAWGANIFLTLGSLPLLAKVEQRFALGPWISKIFWRLKWNIPLHNFHLKKLRSSIIKIHDGIFSATRVFTRFRFFTILDIYILKNFFIFFFWSLIACGTLFILFTLFDLLDEIIQRKIPFICVMEYFAFLTPQILMIIVPVSVLLGILISLGILEKNSEITAIKAGGWSLYRVAMPILLVATTFCICLFLIQEYILPYANERQDSLHNYIKGRSPEASRRPRTWIFGESGRIYNYKQFNEQDSFVDLNIYEINLSSATILRRIHADFAGINPNGFWTLEKGWIHDYQSKTSPFRLIENDVFNFPENAGYFKKAISQPKESSQKTYSELSKYINYLMKSGYNAIELQVELCKKTAFPVSCLVMTLLGLPFSFSMGKRGAFFGIALSIAIAILYWGISGVFGAMGSYGLLVPILAAWAPNILFGAAGLALFLAIRT